MTWQPIATAPLDGTEILLYTERGIVQARFCPGEWHDYLEGREYDGPVWSCVDDAFQIEIEETPDGLLHGEATHWAPLPSPPAKEEED